MRFSFYSDRKNVIKSEPLPIISYINPKNPLKDNKKLGNVNFKKMIDREEFSKISYNPSICYYEPKYDYLDKSQKIVKFDNKNIDDIKIKKKNILKKILCSYHVSTHFNIVQIKEKAKIKEKDFIINY